MQHGANRGQTRPMAEDAEIYEVMRTREVVEHEELPGELQALERERTREEHRAARTGRWRLKKIRR